MHNFQEPTNKPVSPYSYSSAEFLDRPLVARATKRFDFCPCDNDNICFDKKHVGLTYINSLIRVCAFAYPNDATLNVTFWQLFSSEELLLPSLEVQYDEANKNMAIITAELPAEFFDDGILGGTVSVAVKVDIFVVGSKTRGEAAFILQYDLRPVTDSPTYTPTTTASPSIEPPLGAKACICDPTTNLCLERDASYISYGSRDAEICVL